MFHSNSNNLVYEDENSFFQHAEKHSRLLSDISKLESLLAKLTTASEALDDLECELMLSEKRLVEIRTIRENEHKQYESAHHSSKRVIPTITPGRKAALSEKIKTHQDGYMNAMELEQTQVTLVEKLKSQVAETKRLKLHYEGDAQKYQELRNRLDQLYRIAFDGETPDFPEEDEAELALANAHDSYKTHDYEHKLAHQVMKYDKMKSARNACDTAIESYQKAFELDNCTCEEGRNLTATGDAELLNASTLLREASRLPRLDGTTSIEFVPPPKLAVYYQRRNLETFDEIAEIFFKPQIQKNLGHARSYLSVISLQCDMCKIKAESLQTLLEDDKKNISEAQTRLLEVRRNILQEVGKKARDVLPRYDTIGHGEGSSRNAPPSYGPPDHRKSQEDARTDLTEQEGKSALRDESPKPDPEQRSSFASNNPYRNLK